MAAGTVSRTMHFALHRLLLESAPPVLPGAAAAGARPLFPAAEQEPWLGAMVPKRWARRAVTRNAIKRQIYAAGAAFEGELPMAAHVVRLRAGFDRRQFTSATSDVLKRAVREELHQLFRQALAGWQP
ncbi:ribonuclease P protein component [Curvibacter soli]|uniref:ribonuclease P protein component n=1 Tax=Curvibacter soli TaxID=3031331 RepID=UPI003AF0CB85